eukprot:UN18966
MLVLNSFSLNHMLVTYVYVLRIIKLLSKILRWFAFIVFQTFCELTFSSKICVGLILKCFRELFYYFQKKFMLVKSHVVQNFLKCNVLKK